MIETYRDHFNRKERITPSVYKKLSFVNLASFEDALTTVMRSVISQLAQPNLWIDVTHLDDLLSLSLIKFYPYAHKVVREPGSVFICRGDLHGDVHSLMAFITHLQKLKYLDDLTIIHPQLMLVFHGDYVDNGLWSVEVLFVLMLLKIANPDTVVLLRGNHEDMRVCTQFFEEFHAKYAGDPNAQFVFNKVIQFFELLPVVLYIGSGSSGKDFVQCCHGGLEPGYNPKQLLASDKTYQMITHLDRHRFFSEHSHLAAIDQGEIVPLKELYTDISPILCQDLGFLWSDFVVDPNGLSQYREYRPLCNKELTLAVLEEASTKENRLVGVIRAHQHTPSDTEPLMKLLFAHGGCAFLWKDNHRMSFEPGTVITLLLSPDSLYGMSQRGYDGFEFDTSLVVKTGNELHEWEVAVIKFNLYEMRLLDKS